MGIGNKSYVDVYIQDQHTPLHNWYFKKLLNTVTLKDNVNLLSKTVTLESGHGCQAGEYLSIIENDFAYQGKILNVNNDVLTLDTPIDYEYSINADIARTSVDMNINGSVTPQIFTINPIQNARWDIYQINFQITDGTEMDSAKFGGISSLTNGLIIRKKISNTEYINYDNIKSNSDFLILGFCIQYDDKAPAGVYGLNACKNNHSVNGITIRLDGSKNEELQILINDDLTALTSIRCAVHCHNVEGR